MQGLPLIVVLSLVVYRVTRFVLDDTLLEEWRWKLQDRLKGPRSERDMTGEPKSMWRRKLLSLTDCPYCISVWIAGGAVIITAQLQPVPLPVWTWLATCGATMGWWRLIETPHE